jgi:hypothetical protein
MAKTKAQTKKFFTVNIEMNVTVYSSIRVKAKTQANAEAKAEELANDLFRVDFSGDSEETQELSGNSSFDVEDVHLSTEEED